MPGFVPLLRCVGRAVVKNGFRALASLVPFGEVAFDIARDIFEEYRQEGDLRQELESLAQASPGEVQQQAEKIATDQPAEVRLALVSYLEQIPATIRQSLRRAADPAGKTFAADRRLQKPEDLLPFLPTALPRFKPGDQPLAADWELVELLGKGGFGEVWKAHHLTRSSQRPVALKFCLNPIAAHSLRNEAVLHDQLYRIHGQGIVPLLETYLRADPPCLMYEYIEGGDLTGLMRERRINPSLATRLVQRLASIVAHAHRLDPPLVHRDLKPANVLLRRGESGKLSLFVADFGIGGLARHATERNQVSIRSRTLPSAVRGAYTPLYASPQQIQGEKPHPRDDVHALGVIWYQLLTGNLRMLSIPPDWRDVAEECGLDEERIRLLASCIASRPEKRPGDAGELAERLQTVSKPTVTNDIAPPSLATMVDLSIRGKWFARPAANLEGPWTVVRELPGNVILQPEEVYHLNVDSEVRDGELASVAQLSHSPSLRSLDLSGCETLTDDALVHLRGLTSLQSLRLFNCKQITDVGLSYLSDLSTLQSLDLEGCEEVTDDGLVHLRNLTSLRRLNLCGCERVTDSGLVHLSDLASMHSLDLALCALVTSKGLAHLRTLDSLHELRLDNCEMVTDEAIAELRSLYSLKSLSVLGCRVTDKGLFHLKDLNDLQSLDLSECENVTDMGLAHLRNLTSLQSLSLYGCEKVTDDGLVHLRNLTSLQELDLDGCERLTDAGLAHLSQLTRLQSLNLGGCKQMTDSGLAHLKGLLSLQSLGLSRCEKLTGTGLSELRNMSSLQSLNLSFNSRLTDIGLTHLKTLTCLRKVHLDFCEQVTDDGLAHLTNLVFLQSLRLCACRKITDNAVAVLQQALPGCKIWYAGAGERANSSAATKALELTVRGQWFSRSSAFPDASWAFVRELPGEVSLVDGEAYQIKIAPDVKDEEFGCMAEKLQNLSSLWSLDLSRCKQVTDYGLAHLRLLTSLRSLNLFGCERVTNDGLSHLRGLTSLQSLRLSCCEITDRGLEHLRRLTSLRSLELSWCKVTNAGLEYLRSLPSLQKLSMYGCEKVTESGVTALRHSLPACVIFR